MMTKEDYEVVSKYSNHIYTATKHNYTRNIPSSELDILLDIYKRTTNQNYRLCKHCSTSIMNFIKELGKVYYRAKETYEITEKENTKKNGKRKKENANKNE